MNSIGSVSQIVMPETTMLQPKSPIVKQEKQPEMASDSISLSNAKAPVERGNKIKVNINPHDPAVCKPQIVELDQDMIGTNLSSPQMKAIDTYNPVAIADIDGNYIFDLGTPQFDQVNAYTCAHKTMDMWADFKGSPVKWAFGDTPLSINAHKREGMNAYYARNERSTNFFFFKSNGLGKTVQTSESPDIVSHELGHAVLDSMRPGFLGWDSETMSLHEAFGDMSAMLYALKDDSNIQHILADNGGNFSKSSILSNLGEEFAHGIFLSDNDPKNDDRDYLRNMINNFKYVDPSTLPERAPDDQLANEPHSFSRILSGTTYDILAGLYNKNVDAGMGKEAALKEAGNQLGKLIANGILATPKNNCNYSDFAAALLKTDKQLNGGKNLDMLTKIFENRNIMPKGGNMMNAEAALPNITLNAKQMEDPEVIQNLVAENGKAFGVPDGTTFSMDPATENIYGGKTINLTCTDEMQLNGTQYGEYNGAYVDVKGGLSLDFDKNGKLVDINYDGIDDAKRASTAHGVVDAIAKKLVAEPSRAPKDYGTCTAHAFVDGKGHTKLERLPIIVM